jgi:hypothetical protein
MVKYLGLRLGKTSVFVRAFDHDLDTLRAGEWVSKWVGTNGTFLVKR